MKNYSKSLKVPQTQAIPGRTDMVQNNAGGFVFAITQQQLLERFLLIGSEGGTYYVGEQELTVENARNIIQMVKSDGFAVLDTVVKFVLEHRAPKMDALLFTLALVCTHGDPEVKAKAYSVIPTVCKTSTHLFQFVANIQNLRGWSRGLRSGVAKFYTSKTPDQLAYQLVKYRNRAGFTHRDVLRLSHPSTTTRKLNDLFKYAVGKNPSPKDDLVKAFELAQTSTSNKKLVELISEYRLTWEMIPTEKLNEVPVLAALLKQMSLTALIRNLNRFSSAGMTSGNNSVVQEIVEKLTDPENVKNSGIHPINVVNSMLTYSNGHGFKGNKTWEVNQNIVDALNDTFYLAVNNITPTGKNIMVAVDVSGSMSHAVANSAMSAAQVANVLSLSIIKAEPKAELVWFDTKLVPAKFGRRTSLDDVLKHSPSGGGTDCAQPIIEALKQNVKYDAIVILTDTETWAGRTHGITALEEYRRKVNKDVKVIEVAAVANKTSTLPNDSNILRVVGFDASVVEVIKQFLGE